MQTHYYCLKPREGAQAWERCTGAKRRPLLRLCQICSADAVSSEKTRRRKRDAHAQTTVGPTTVRAARRRGSFYFCNGLALPGGKQRPYIKYCRNTGVPKIRNRFWHFDNCVSLLSAGAVCRPRHSRQTQTGAVVEWVYRAAFSSARPW